MVYYYNIRSCTPQSGHHGAIRVAKNAGREKLLKTASAAYVLDPLHPHKPYGVGTQKHFFSSRSRKMERCMIFDPEGGRAFFLSLALASPQKSGLLGGGGLGGS